MTRAGQVGIITDARKWSIGWWVERITHSPAHHTVIVFNDTTAISAEPGGVRYRQLAEYAHIVYTDYPLTDAQIIAIRWFAQGRLGVGYGYWAFAALGWQYLTGLPLPRALTRWVDRPNRDTCSQLAADIYAAVGVTDTPTNRPVSPADWYTHAQIMGWLDANPTTTT